MIEFNRSFLFCKVARAQRCSTCSSQQQYRWLQLVSASSPIDNFDSYDWKYFCQILAECQQLRGTMSRSHPLPIANYFGLGFALPGGIYLCESCWLDNARCVSIKLGLPYFKEPVMQKGLFHVDPNE